jgi:hypothetical protein
VGCSSRPLDHDSISFSLIGLGLLGSLYVADLKAAGIAA